MQLALLFAGAFLFAAGFATYHFLNSRKLNQKINKLSNITKTLTKDFNQLYKHVSGFAIEITNYETKTTADIENKWEQLKETLATEINDIKSMLEQEIYIEVPRKKPSLRSPLKTFAVEYDRYKARDSGLFQPSEPKRGENS